MGTDEALPLPRCSARRCPRGRRLWQRPGDSHLATRGCPWKISLAKELRGESALSRRVDRVVYQGGYSAQYATNLGGVLSASFEYRGQSAATTVFVYGRGLNPEAVSALANRQNSRIKNAGL
jgi:hypothetical protein